MGTFIGFVFVIVIWGWGVKSLFKSYYWGNSEWLKSWILVFGSLFYFFVIAPIIMMSGYIILVIVIVFLIILFLLSKGESGDAQKLNELESLKKHGNKELEMKRINEVENYLELNIGLSSRLKQQNELIDAQFRKTRPGVYKLYKLEQNEHESLYKIINNELYSVLDSISLDNAGKMREILNSTNVISDLDKFLRNKNLYLLISTSDYGITFYIKKLT